MRARTATENELRAAFEAGDELDLTGRAERAVRGDVISGLLREAGCDDPGYAPPLRLRGAEITGRLDLDGTNVASRVLLHNCELPGGASLVDATTRAITLDGCAISGLNLRSAVVRGRLSLREARLEESEGFALNCDTATVEESLRLDGTQVSGLASMRSVRVDRQLVIAAAELCNRGECALTARSAVIGRDLMGANVVAAGGLALENCTVGGLLELSGAQLHSPDGSALSARGAEFSRSVLLTNSFFARGVVTLAWSIAKQGIDFSRSRCKGTLDLSYSTVSGGIFGELSRVEARDGFAIDLQGASVTKDVWLESAVALGGINAQSLRVDNNLQLRFSELSSLDAHAIRVGHDFDLNAAHIAEQLELIEATTTQFIDKLAVLPDTVLLNGFTYTTLYPHDAPATRIPWVRRNETLDSQVRTQPYEQLARNYRNLGNDRYARAVLCAKERDITRCNTPLWRKPGRYFLEGLVGYGHFPGRAAAWVVGAWLFGVVFFLARPPQPANSAAPAPHPFRPALYGLDVLLPAPDLGLEGHWRPVGAALMVVVLLKLTGWVLSIAVGASISRTLSRK